MGIREYLGGPPRPVGIRETLARIPPASLGEFLARSRRTNRDEEDWGFADGTERQTQIRDLNYANDIVAREPDNGRPHTPGYPGRTKPARGYPKDGELRRGGSLCKCPQCGHRFSLEKSTDDRQQEAEASEALRALRQVRGALESDVRHERAEERGERVRKSYDAEERRDVRRKKTEEYGKGEVFAVPSLRSYPLTKNGKPSRERVKAAWAYLHVGSNRAKIGEKAADAAERRIRAFAKRHFAGVELEG